MKPDSNIGIGIGAALLLLSTVALLATGLVTTPLPSAVAAVAVLTMAAGAVLVGTAVDGNPV